ncbi:hypothetical protein HUJ04_003247 [Dendroctonus ponderosae]|nr:hypothetical protein HUJ04_003247 [Dendroctonus ponderosae]
MENIKKQRSIVKSSITRIKTFVTNNDTVSNINVSEYVTREVFLEKAYKNYCKIQNNIELMDQSDETDSGQGEHYGKEFNFNSEDGKVLGIEWQPGHHRDSNSRILGCTYGSIWGMYLYQIYGDKSVPSNFLRSKFRIAPIKTE